MGLSSLLVILFFLTAGKAIGLQNDPLWRPSESTSHRLANVTSISFEKNETVAEIEGPGIIRHIWITVKCEIPQIHGLLILRIWWDDEKTPSVEVPLGDFFGIGFGKEKPLKSLMLEVFPAGGEHHASLNCYWEMPFRKSARIEIENKGKRTVSMFFIQLDYEKPHSLPEDTLYFHAQYRRENPVALHRPYTILEAKGTGNYVGTILNYHLLGPGAWVEGGQSFYIDGEKEPSLPGTGGEDYFGHAWGFRFENNALFHGTSFGITDNKMTAYRFHVPDPVRFKKSIRAEMRCHGWDVGDRRDDYSSVALWYQGEPHAPFPPLPEPDYDLLELAEIYRKSPGELLKEKEKKIKFTGENLALNAKNWKESGHNDLDQSGDYAFDGDPFTKWCEVKNPDEHWLALDLGAPSIIEGFVLKNPGLIGDSPGFDVARFRIEKGETLEGPWKTVYRGTNTQERDENGEAKSSLNVIPMEKPLEARFIRLFITKSCFLDPFARIQEFEIWGKYKNDHD